MTGGDALGESAEVNQQIAVAILTQACPIGMAYKLPGFDFAYAERAITAALASKEDSNGSR